MAASLFKTLKFHRPFLSSIARNPARCSPFSPFSSASSRPLASESQGCRRSLDSFLEGFSDGMFLQSNLFPMMQIKREEDGPDCFCSSREPSPSALAPGSSSGGRRRFVFLFSHRLTMCLFGLFGNMRYLVVITDGNVGL